MFIYQKNLKNRFLTVSTFPQNLSTHLRLAIRQWSLDPYLNFEGPPCQILDSSSSFGIQRIFFAVLFGCAIPMGVGIIFNELILFQVNEINQSLELLANGRGNRAFISFNS